ncbi:MOSC domain-containing protein [Peptoniphilus equinus]|uniref:MOSC domain-containing protein n=1 Tax=Peptoniphilus equinus TaxID=3016343 RepID=A0ABY7QVD0_9FIRM|nr:MOSC domain-containing protein [Peptoniphilus equinus]
MPVDKACLVREHGIEHDAHAGAWHRQVSLLGEESIEYMRRTAKMELKFGDFAENLTTEGIELKRLPIGTRLRIGDCAVIEITQIGKECHADCAIKQKIHDCIMPREGIFARVLIGGMIYPGDVIRSL